MQSDSGPRQHPRYDINQPGKLVVDGRTHDATVVNVSTGGAAVTDVPLFSNDMFIELHMEGVATMEGRVVRQVGSGFALVFDDKYEGNKEARHARDDFVKTLRGRETC